MRFRRRETHSIYRDPATVVWARAARVVTRRTVTGRTVARPLCCSVKERDSERQEKNTLSGSHKEQRVGENVRRPFTDGSIVARDVCASVREITKMAIQSRSDGESNVRTCFL